MAREALITRVIEQALRVVTEDPSLDWDQQLERLDEEIRSIPDGPEVAATAKPGDDSVIAALKVQLESSLSWADSRVEHAEAERDAATRREQAFELGLAQIEQSVRAALERKK